MRRWWRRWSPWRLRAELTFIRDCLADDRGMMADNFGNTVVEQRYRHAAFVLLGDPDPWSDAQRFSVRGSTLHIDAT